MMDSTPPDEERLGMCEAERQYWKRRESPLFGILREEIVKNHTGAYADIEKAKRDGKLNTLGQLADFYEAWADRLRELGEDERVDTVYARNGVISYTLDESIIVED